MSNIAFDFIKSKKISLSRENINFIINKCKNDREVLVDELQKIELFSKSGKQLNNESLNKLINLHENHSVVLADTCLAKIKK